MTKEDTDLIGDAIDFYNLNHFKGKDTKKRLVTLKKEIKALTIPFVVGQSEQLVCTNCKTRDMITLDGKECIRCGTHQTN